LFSSDNSPCCHSSNIDPALIDPSIYQTEVAQANPARFDYLDTARTESSILNGTLDLHMLGSANDCNVGFLLPAAQAGSADTAWNDLANTDAGHPSPYISNAFDIAFQEREADIMGLQAQNLMMDETIQYRSAHAFDPEPFSSPAKHQAPERTCDMFACPQSCSPEMHTSEHAVLQSYCSHDGMAVDNSFSAQMHALSNNRSHTPRIVTSHSKVKRKGIRSRVKSNAPSKSVACPICKRKLRDGSTLRYVNLVHS